MNTNTYLEYLTKQIHTVIMATTDNFGNPFTCVIDIMDFDEHGLYFLTAKGKSFYERLKQNNTISLTGLQGNATLSSRSVTIHGKVKEISSFRLSALFEKNPYMYEIYPTKESCMALTVFQIYQGNGGFFDLSVHPIFREQFSFGDSKIEKKGLLYINDNCMNCRKCISVCPQKCIVYKNNQTTILQEHCLHCGNCYNICPVKAIENQG